jgi:hypothetical protein
MRTIRVEPQWRRRLLTGAALGAGGFAAGTWLDFEPQPLAYALMVVIVLSGVWLVLDTVDAPAAQWRSGPPGREDRVDEATSDLRILSSHQQATTPSPAVRDRLVGLARARDPDLAATLQDELDPERRLTPAQIDRILTRIEEARDRR